MNGRPSAAPAPCVVTSSANRVGRAAPESGRPVGAKQGKSLSTAATDGRQFEMSNSVRIFGQKIDMSQDPVNGTDKFDSEKNKPWRLMRVCAGGCESLRQRRRTVGSCRPRTSLVETQRRRWNAGAFGGLRDAAGRHTIDAEPSTRLRRSSCGRRTPRALVRRLWRLACGGGLQAGRVGGGLGDAALLDEQALHIATSKPKSDFDNGDPAAAASDKKDA